MSDPEKGQALFMRPMGRDDLDAVWRLECVAYEFPWSRGILEDCLRVGYHCRVGLVAGEILVYGIMSAAVGECHIFNLCVHPSWQRKGLGRRMLRHLLARALDQHADTAFLEVRVSNAGARALYAAEGFCEIGLRKGYYPARGGREDATVLARDLRGLGPEGGLGREAV